jgi:ABC-type phosphate transport system permease subunit
MDMLHVLYLPMNVVPCLCLCMDVLPAFPLLVYGCFTLAMFIYGSDATFALFVC